MKRAVEKQRLLLLAAALLSLWGWSSNTAKAQTEARPFVSPMFSDNMVLQRGQAVPVWGWAKAGKKVQVSVAGKSGSAIADADGKWVAKVGPLPVGGPYDLKISGAQSATYHNVLVGDVWVCSGQSNMEMGIGNVNNAEEEIKSANYPQIRLFTVQKAVAYSPRQTVIGKWDVCTPSTVSSSGWGGFSAVGYFFGRKLYQELKIPIGLIHTSWGGTIAEAWTSAEALSAMSDFQGALVQVEEQRKNAGNASYRYENALAEWWEKNDPGTAARYHETSLSEANGADWQNMTLPAAWEDSGLPNFDGVVWFRKEFDLPEDAAGKNLALHLGPIDDVDTTWVNGVKVGETNGYNIPRNYTIPANILRPGKNVIAVRVLDTGGAGGFYGKADELRVEIPGKANLILAGPWTYKSTAPLGRTKPVPQRMDNNPNVVTVLYNGMIAPVVPYGIKGAIWYQGESNAGRAYQYRKLLPTMIADWRSRFGVGNFPFYIVQLANFMAVDNEPKNDPWPELREAQLMTAQNVPNSGLAVAIDIGDAVDIHPKDKQNVGLRLALNALAKTYGHKIEYSGPNYVGMKVQGSQAHLTFDHLGGGLMAKDSSDTTVKGFAIAGEDRKFVWAEARIEGDKVIVWSPQVPHPVAVRYAWSNNPVSNLFNKAGLPASPFRTDTWPGVTANAK